VLGLCADGHRIKA